MATSSTAAPLLTPTAAATPATGGAARVSFLDLLRVLACFMVIMVHSGEFFYIGPGDSIIRDHTYGTGGYGSALRACVPLFVLSSGYLLLPIREAAGTFFRRRYTRVLIPLLAWSVVYVFYFQGLGNLAELGKHLLLIAVNFSSGHLWFMYMLLGLYAFAPVVSPWLREVSAREERWFLLAWGVTLLLPFARLYYPEVWGEAFWNHIGGAYYFSGYLGYFVLGHYLRVHFRLGAARSRVLGLALLLVGYGLTYWGFAARLPWAHTIPELELTWSFPTFNVALMTLGWFLLLKDARLPSPRLQQVVARMAHLSFGVYLAHILVLEQWHRLLVGVLAPGLVFIPVLAVLTFGTTYLLITLLSYLPGSKYLVG